MVRPARHDWYLQEWLAACGKKQADVVRDLEWNKARVSLMVSGKQQYTRDAVNDVADWLHIRPYELLMHPEDAMALRRLRDTAIKIAAERDPDEETGSEASRANGTHG